MAAVKPEYIWEAVPLLILTCLFAVSAEAQYGGGSGEPNDPYLIYTAEQMNAIGADPNDWDKHFQLMADIDLGRYSGTEFNSIGRPDFERHRSFVGVFDGNGHTISNFTWTSDARDAVGLFGSVGRPLGRPGRWNEFAPKIKNLGLLNPRVEAGAGHYVGSLVGCVYSAGIVDCYVEGVVVSGSGAVGGLIGGTSQATVTACYSTGDVAGETSTGGLIGSNSGCIMNCYSHANVACMQSVGGLVGYNLSDGTIVNCYSTGAVTGKYWVGGLVGNDSGGTVGSYWDIETSGRRESAGGWGRNTPDMHAASTFRGWALPGGERVWTLDEGRDYPRLHWEHRPGQGLAVVALRDLLAGAGTQNSPFLIRTAEELNWIAQFPHDWDKHFQLAADIDLSGQGATWPSVIGAYGLPFTGTFDGKGHAITGLHHSTLDGSFRGLFGCISDPDAEVRDLTLLAPTVASDTGYWIGALAGALEYGRILNCTVEDAVVSGTWVTGGLVGSNYDGAVTDCHATSTLNTRDITGGLVGHNQGVLRNCSSAGVVAGNSLVGGLAGFTGNYGSVANCSSSSRVAGASEVGGLAGCNSFYGVVMNCYATGSIAGESCTGGLVGRHSYHSTIMNCYAAGAVIGKEQVGGLIGEDEGDATSIIASYWDITATGRTGSAGGIGLETVAMKAANTFLDAGWDFIGETVNGVEDVWWILEDKDYPRLFWELPADQ